MHDFIWICVLRIITLMSFCRDTFYSHYYTILLLSILVWKISKNRPRNILSELCDTCFTFVCMSQMVAAAAALNAWQQHNSTAVQTHFVIFR